MDGESACHDVGVTIMEIDLGSMYNFGTWEDEDFIIFCDWHLAEAIKFEEGSGFNGGNYGHDSWIESLTSPIILESFIRLYGRENIVNYDEFNARIIEDDFDNLPANVKEWGDFERYIYCIIMEKTFFNMEEKPKTFKQLMDNLESIADVIKESLRE